MPTSPDILPVRYRPELEHVNPSEAATDAELAQTVVKMAKIVADKEGHGFRAVHAKGQGLLRGALTVADGLPMAFAQGLFEQRGEYPVLMRFSSPPAEQLTDDVSTPRAVALKVLDVPGDLVPEALGRSQDFLMVNGPVFSRPGPDGFLKDLKLLASTTEKAPGGKAMLSAVMRGTERALEAVGLESAKLKGMGGHPQVHPLGETYFSQVPFLFGPYVAKFSLAPRSPSLAALHGQPLDAEGDDAQREAIARFFGAAAQTEPAQWSLRVQLCVNEEEMPIEDASIVWPEDLSPWVTVATLTIGSQSSWNGESTQAEEDALAFSPWNALAAHRPLGAINRARKVAMAASREFRTSFNRCPIRHPASS